mgnify:CR=1 FL=1
MLGATLGSIEGGQLGNADTAVCDVEGSEDGTSLLITISGLLVRAVPLGEGWDVIGERLGVRVGIAVGGDGIGEQPMMENCPIWPSV